MAEDRGITWGDLKGALVWLPVIGALGYGIVKWTETQTHVADIDSRLTAIEGLVTFDRIREQVASRVNTERDIRELRREIERVRGECAAR